MKDTETITQALPEHHRRLERIFDALVAQAYEGDPIALRSEWDGFERELLRHMELEEKELLPTFAREQRAGADRLRAEHAQIRAALIEMAISLDLHALRADAVRDFVALLKEHARREDRLFYPWAHQHPPAQGWEAVETELAGAPERARPNR
jgi:hemerythrin-like domain-containing protein